MKNLTAGFQVVLSIAAVGFSINLGYCQLGYVTEESAFDKKSTSEAKIAILSQSEVKIKGTTNVNSFTCSSNEEISSYSNKVVFSTFNDQLILNPAFIELHSGGFDCGIKGLTRDFKELLNSSDYPHIKIEVLGWKELDDKSNIQTVQLNANLTITGVTREIQIPIQISRNDDQYICEGVTEINITEFNIDPPRRLLGLVKVKSHIEIEFKLYLEIQLSAKTISTSK